MKSEEEKKIHGFSRLSKKGKIKWLVENFFRDPEAVMKELISYWHNDNSQQEVLDGFSENTISNFPLPFGIAPNFVINGKTYAVPMVIEESSVVAAASAAAKYWMSRGGVQAEVLSMKKEGQLHFNTSLGIIELQALWPEIKAHLIERMKPLSVNMEKRGGGLLDIELLDFSAQLENYYQIKAQFDTCDSMGANYINTILEDWGEALSDFINAHPDIPEEKKDLEILMAILSNHTPECLVKVECSCAIEALEDKKISDPEEFANRFKQAVDIARIDPYRAATHNKGIFNGMDAVVIATGNDFRAVEAAGHAFAAQSGSYRSLSQCEIEDGRFCFSLTVPLAVGTVGGLTALHPIAKRALEMLDNPGAEELMKIIASVGLAQNFSALRSLITTGIQKGHMKMHLLNILNHLNVSGEDKQAAIEHFMEKKVSFRLVRDFLNELQERREKTI